MFGLHTKDARAKIIRADAASYSTLAKFDRTAAHARYAMQHPSEPTAAMERGTALHLAVLEPDRFDAEVAVTPRIDRRTKEGKAAWVKFQSENVGKVLLDEDDHAACMAMRDAVWSHPIAAEMLRGPGYCEVGAIWEDPTTGQACKALIDREREKDCDRWTDAMMACRSVAPFGRPAVDALARHFGAIVSRCFGCGSVYRAVDPEGADCGVSDGLCSARCGVPEDAITPLEDMQ